MAAIVKSSISIKDLENFGLHEIIYVKKSALDDERYAIHAADGTILAVLEDPESAYAAATENDLKLLSVH